MPSEFQDFLTIFTFHFWTKVLSYLLPITMTAQFQVYVCGRPHAGIAGSNPAVSMIVCLFDSCVLSGRGLCDGQLSRPEESYRVRAVWNLDVEKALLHGKMIFLFLSIY
jgi:hypothetical protein